ncbi:MAG: O-antigen ligase family protein [Candidatus Eiseniibacteriota bacterium]
MSPATPSSGALGRPGHAHPRSGAGLPRRLAPRRSGRADWASRLIGIGLLVGAGVVLGLNYFAPDKRMIAVMVATLVFGIAWRIDPVSAIGVLVLALPYPRGTVFGSTNVALVLLLLLIWLLRISTRQAAPPRRTPVDAPIIALLIAFTVSFYNIDTTWNLVRALENFAQILAGFAMFYLVVNNLRRPEHLERVHVFQCVSIAMVCLLGVFELVNPNGTFIPGWIGFRHGISEGVNIHNVRIGGPFYDFELLSEYCAINLFLLLLLVIRARSGARRLAFGALFALTFFILFATVTRGGILAFAAGLLYLLWVTRKRLQFVPVTVALAATVVAFLVMNYYVANFTNSGDLIGRLSNPESWQFKDGMPAARAPIWQAAFERMMIHPIIGHCPVYNTDKGLDFWFWPHNGYLYIGNLVGFVGLACYLWLLFQLWRSSRPVSLDLKDANYARAYLLIAHVQLVVFAVDQLKIDFLRNPTYPFQVWMLFAYIVCAHRLSQGSQAVPAPSRPRS